MNTGMLISRAVHLATCLLLFGTEAFVALTLPAPMGESSARRWHCRRQIMLSCVFPLLLLSGGAWFALATTGMTDSPLSFAGMRMVWTHTHFGRLWQLRTILAAVSIAISRFSPGKWISAISLVFSGSLLATLAWSGHGQLGAWRSVHLAVDVVHLIAGGLWPTGLLPLAIVLSDRSLTPVDAAALLVRFSQISVACVCVLALSGIGNSLCTVSHLDDFLTTRYGVVLIGKVAVVIAMVCIGAANLRAVKRNETLRIRVRVMIEIGLAVLVIASTAWLGMLEP